MNRFRAKNERRITASGRDFRNAAIDATTAMSGEVIGVPIGAKIGPNDMMKIETIIREPVGIGIQTAHQRGQIGITSVRHTIANDVKTVVSDGLNAR